MRNKQQYLSLPYNPALFTLQSCIKSNSQSAEKSRDFA